MIDTIRIKLGINVSTEYVRRHFDSYIKRKAGSTLNEVEFYTYVYQDPSYVSTVRFMYDAVSRDVIVECSIPKLLFGHNLFILDDEEMNRGLLRLRCLVQEVLNIDSFPKSVQVMRLDVCYAWDLHNEKTMNQLLTYFKTFNVARKAKMTYNTSVMYKGKEYSYKVYQKYPEYKKHDYRRLYDVDPRLADEILEWSRFVLRFEVSIRKPQLLVELGTNLLDKIKIDDIHYLLNSYFDKFKAKNIMEYQSRSRVINKLLITYSKRKAVKLFKDWLLLNSNDLESLKIHETMYSREQIWRIKNDLYRAGVGILADDPVDLDLLIIPSPRVPAAAARAAAAV